MTQKEQARLKILNSLLAEQITLEQAATLMRVSERHTRRILAAYREEGAAALAHGHRGRRAPNTTSEKVKSFVMHLTRTRYSETNHTHLSELLREREGIVIGRTTLRRILVGAGLGSPRRPPATETPSTPSTYALRGDADTDRRQLPSVAWKGRAGVHIAFGR